MYFKQEYLYFLAGISLLVVACYSWLDKHNPRRITTGAFWFLYGLIFLVGEWSNQLLTYVIDDAAQAKAMINFTVGVLVVIMALIAGLGGVKLGKYPTLSKQQRQENAKKFGIKLFVPALMIPIGTVLGVLIFHNAALARWFFGEGVHVSTLITLFSMTAGCILGLIIALKMTGDKLSQPFHESRRLLDSIGWAFILPQILATIGLLFNDAGVGRSITQLVTDYLNIDSRLIAVTVYAVGMALLTMVLGNAFASFPIMAAGVGIPILVNQLGGDPAVMAAIGMFSGYCGTLMTPMAANYNLVPAALLNLPDRYQVIKVQIPTALLLLFVNIILLYFFLFI
ncbi:DUF979 domain-containing protein [Orbaceae bacterium ESL0727]|nr:DUF979 domain-containing protein [Orbaceae bacterium ESL0727]